MLVVISDRKAEIGLISQNLWIGRTQIMRSYVLIGDFARNVLGNDTFTIAVTIYLQRLGKMGGTLDC